MSICKNSDNLTGIRKNIRHLLEKRRATCKKQKISAAKLSFLYFGYQSRDGTERTSTAGRLKNGGAAVKQDGCPEGHGAEDHTGQNQQLY